MPHRNRPLNWRWRSTSIVLAMVLAGMAFGSIPACKAPDGAGQEAIAEPATGSRFSIQQEAGVFWLAKPDGQRFFSFGVNCANRGETDSHAEMLAYNAGRLYSSDAIWAQSVTDRLTDWGFTTVGG
jgi:hypothetical protein